MIKETKKVIILPVYITADLDGCLEFKQHGLTDEQITASQTEHLDLWFGEIDLFPRSSSSDTVIKSKKKKGWVTSSKV